MHIKYVLITMKLSYKPIAKIYLEKPQIVPNSINYF